MHLVRIAGGTHIDQLAQLTGVSGPALRDLVPQGRIRDGVIATAFDLAIPAEYGTPRTMADAPVVPASGAVNLRAQTRQVSSRLETAKETARSVGREANTYTKGWTQLALAAKSVFDKPYLPHGRQIERADRIVSTLLNGFAHIEAVAAKAKAELADLPPAARKERREAENTVERMRPTLEMALETTFNALPRMLDVPGEPAGDYFSTYRSMIGKGDADGLRNVFERMRTTAAAIDGAEANHGQAVADAVSKMSAKRFEWHDAIAKPVQDVWERPGLKRDIPKARALFGAAQRALTEAPAAVVDAQEQLATLTGPGTQALASRLSDAITSLEAAPLRLMQQLILRVPRLLEVNDPIDRKAVEDAGPEALAQIFDRLVKRAEDIASAESRFGARVAHALGDIDQTERALLAPVKTGTDPAAVWTAAKTVLAESGQYRTKWGGLLADLEKTPGADALHFNLSRRIDQVSQAPARLALREAANKLPRLFGLTFYDHIPEGRISDLAGTGDIARLDAYFDHLAAVDASRTRANKELGSQVADFEKKVGSSVKSWSAAVADLASLTADGARAKYATLTTAMTGLNSLLDEAAGLTAKLEPFGHGGTELKVDVSNARGTAEQTIVALLRETPRRLAKALDVPFDFIPYEGDLFDWAREKDTAKLDAAIETIASAADTADAIKREHGPRYTQLTADLNTVMDDLRNAQSTKDTVALSSLLPVARELQQARTEMLDGVLSPPEAGNLRGQLYRADPQYTIRGAEAVGAVHASSGSSDGTTNATVAGVLAGFCAPVQLGQLFSVVDPGLGSIRFAEGQDPTALRQAFADKGIHTIAIRHGKTDANAMADTGEPVLSGQSEASLTFEGNKQATAAARKLYADLGGDAWLRSAVEDPSRFPVVYSSTLSRARNTGDAFVDAVKARAVDLAFDATSLAVIDKHLRITEDPRLLEMNYGDFELRKISELAERLPDLHASWESYAGLGVNFVDQFPAGESRLDILQRLGDFFNDVLDRHAGRTVLMYCHLETIAMARTLMGHSGQHDGQLQVDAKAITNAKPHVLS